MDITTGLASRLYAGARDAMKPAAEGPGAAAAQAVDSFAETLRQAENTANATLAGEGRSPRACRCARAVAACGRDCGFGAQQGRRSLSRNPADAGLTHDGGSVL